MELELNTPEKLVQRLDKMKNVLQKGCIINCMKLEREMLGREGNFNKVKKANSNFQAAKRIMLERADLKLRHTITNRADVLHRVKASLYHEKVEKLIAKEAAKPRENSNKAQLQLAADAGRRKSVQK